ncbi:MAG: diguanylate cyclase, partial [Candidatus Obscuribacterales bacterium]|nr:diguanylate cyclase [Candidatus Obscuribacterales bacterium]
VKADAPDKAFKLATDLRSLPGYDTLPLAFISASAEVRPAAEAAHVGASLHLDKPLDAAALEAAVRHLVAIRQGGRPKVMVVDDDPDFTAKIAFDLRNDNLLVRTVHDPTKLLDALQEFPPDVMLLDVMMPNMNGFEVCQMLRGMPRWRDLPIIFITAEIHIEARVKAFTSGGDDYLPKPVVTEELLARVRVRLEKSRLLRERSDKDTITGLLLRRAFVEQFNAMLADVERLNSIMSVCLMDVDHFKKVNDTYGHMAGDSVLSGFGALLLRRFRVDDIRGRWGGEEFIIAFRRENKTTMRAAINRVQEEFSKMVFESDDGKQFSVTFSGGVASYPDDGKTLHELLTIADKRLYDAKHAGRRRIFIDDNGN